MVLELNIPADIVELNFPNGLSNEAFEELCFSNKELVVEREPSGKITVMSPVSGRSGRSELKFNGALYNYIMEHGGESFSSSTGFTLPDGSMKSPDACFVSAAKIALLTDEDFDHFLEVVPDFVVEVVSPTDQLNIAKNKMRDVWMANGVRLGWLVDVPNQKLWIYRSEENIDIIEDFNRTIDGEDILPGFEFNLRNLR